MKEPCEAWFLYSHSSIFYGECGLLNRVTSLWTTSFCVTSTLQPLMLSLIAVSTTLWVPEAIEDGLNLAVEVFVRKCGNVNKFHFVMIFFKWIWSGILGLPKKISKMVKFARNYVVFNWKDVWIVSILICACIFTPILLSSLWGY